MKRVLLVLLATSVTAFAQSRYTDAMYRKAILDDSTSPLYVLFTLHDTKTGTNRPVCTGGNFLVGAIHMEYHLDYDAAGEKRGHDIALRQPGHKFAFTTHKALKNIDPGYTPQMLAEARHRFSGRSTTELRRAVDKGEVEKFCRRGHDVVIWDRWQAAVAHVFLEHGILVGSADITGALYVER
jgi:hypothetical protein